MVCNPKREPKVPGPPPKGQARIDLTEHVLQIERESKEGRLYVDRLQRAARRATNPLLKAYSSQPDPKVLDRMTKSLQRNMGMSSTSSSTAMARSVMRSSRAGSRSGLSVGTWDEIQPQVKTLQEELQALDEEVARREVALNARIIKATGTNKEAPVSPEGASKFIKEGSNVVGSNFKWTNTMEKSVYSSDLAWPKHNPSTHMKFMGGRYGEITRQLDIPGGNIYARPGMATRQIRPIDRKSSTSDFLKITWSKENR